MLFCEELWGQRQARGAAACLHGGGGELVEAARACHASAQGVRAVCGRREGGVRKV